MKIKLITLGILTAGTLAAMAAYSSPDYKKIKKDITVMSQIITGAFKEDNECNGCRIKLSTNYLANQGAIFTVESRTRSRSNRHRSYSYSTSDSRHDSQNMDTYVTEELEGLEELEVLAELEGLEGLEGLEELQELEILENLPEMLSTIFVTVGESLEEAGHQIDIDGASYGSSNDVDREAERALSRASKSSLRELKRNRRELEYQVREHEIELIHAKDDKDRKQKEQAISKLQKSITRVETQEAEVRSKLDKVKEMKLERITKLKQKAKSHRDADFKLTQDIVLQSFCDYGSTLKHLPDSERVSVVFKQSNSKQDQIFVLKKSQLDDCDSKKLRSKALTYLF